MFNSKIISLSLNSPKDLKLLLLLLHFFLIFLGVLAFLLWEISSILTQAKVQTSKIDHAEVLPNVVEAEMEHYIKELDRKNKEFEDVKLKFWDYTIINQIIPAKKKMLYISYWKSWWKKMKRKLRLPQCLCVRYYCYSFKRENKQGSLMKSMFYYAKENEKEKN